MPILSDQMLARFAERAPEYDRTGRFFAEDFQELRDAGLKAYAAAKAKDRDKMIELSETVNDACVHCHQKWRPRKTANRCK